MKTTTSNKTTNENSLSNNLNTVSVEIEFIVLELAFLKKLIKYYPFKSNIPNLFEQLQLFVIELNDFEILTQTLKNESEILKANFNSNSYKKLTTKFYTHKEKYYYLKTKIYDYVSGIMEPETKNKNHENKN